MTCHAKDPRAVRGPVTAGPEPRVLISLTDRPLMSALADALRQDGIAPVLHGTPEAALAELGGGAVRLAIVALRMPRLDGLEIMRRARRSGAGFVLVVDAEDAFGEVVALRAGAEDVLRAGAPVSVMHARILHALERPRARPADTDAQTIVVGDLTLVPERMDVAWCGQPVRLTGTEFRLLRFLAERPGHVRTREQILDILYAGEIHVLDRTIDSHVKRVRRKIRAVDPAFDAIETLYGVGYRLTLPEMQAGPLRLTA